MLRTVLKSKIHGGRVTACHLHYEGSITLAADVLEAAGLLPFEQVHVLNLNNGERFLTYTIKGPRGKFATIHVPKSPNLSKVTLGEKIIVTYTEALAISLEKTESKGGKEAKGAKSK